MRGWATKRLGIVTRKMSQTAATEFVKIRQNNAKRWLDILWGCENRRILERGESREGCCVRRSMNSSTYDEHSPPMARRCSLRGIVSEGGHPVYTLAVCEVRRGFLHMTIAWIKGNPLRSANLPIGYTYPLALAEFELGYPLSIEARW